MDESVQRRRLLRALYADAVASRVHTKLERLLVPVAESASEHRWSELDVWLITYADQFQSADLSPLQTLAAFYEGRLSTICNGVHILPFYPSSSDGGFSVTDYHTVDPSNGTWGDIEALAGHARLMVDGVINHASVQGEWFKRWQTGDAAFDGFFRTADPHADLSAVVRAREHPLLTEFETARGSEWVWTTFSTDQADLDYRNPKVLLAVIEAMVGYVRRGARAVRLDAVGFMWKEEGTPSIHHPKTHLLVQLIGSALRAVRPGLVLITETNVPHAENISYLGDEKTHEADAVYQFPLPPLMLHSYVSEDASKLTEWLAALETPRPDTTFFNFLASHDGVGVRPLEGIVPGDAIDRLVAHTESGPGFVNRRSSAGRSIPYELNATWFDLLRGSGTEADGLARHLGSHVVAMALAGIPGIYAHSLFASSGDRPAAAASGHSRDINRGRFAVDEIEARLGDQTTRAARTLAGFRSMAEWRRTPPFHPDASQTILDVGPAVVAIERSGADGSRAEAYVNVTGETQQLTSINGRRADGAVRAEVDGTTLTLGPWGSAVMRGVEG